MAFNPQEFQSKFKSGWQRPSLFEAWFAEAPDTRFFITNVNLPGRSLVTDTFQTVPEIAIQRPVNATYSGLNFTVILDADGKMIEALNKAQQRVVQDVNGGVFVSYPNEYLTSFRIAQYREDGTTAFVYSMEDSYIASVGDVQLSWAAGDQIATCTCSINYKKYYIDLLGGSGGGSGSGTSAPSDSSEPNVTTGSNGITPSL